MKKILLGLGSIAAVALPATIAISCEFKDVDPDKIWESWLSLETSDISADYNKFEQQILDEAMKLNKETGASYSVHLTISETKDTGAVRVWTGTVFESSFGKTRLEVKNDVDRKLNEFRSWTSDETENYESFIYNDNYEAAKQIFVDELNTVKNMRMVRKITIHVFNHKGGEEMIYIDELPWDFRPEDDIFDGLANIDTVYPNWS